MIICQHLWYCVFSYCIYLFIYGRIVSWCAYLNKNSFMPEDSMRFMKIRYFIILYTYLVLKRV